MDQQMISRITVSLTKASNLLSQISQNVESESANMKSPLWRSAAEAEYAAFLLALGGGLLEYSPELEAASATHLTTRETLDYSRRLLDEAAQQLVRDDRLAYTNIRTAIHLLRSLEKRIRQESA